MTAVFFPMATGITLGGITLQKVKYDNYKVTPVSSSSYYKTRDFPAMIYSALKSNPDKKKYHSSEGGLLGKKVEGMPSINP